jgi:hypothetical protein
MAKRKRKAAKVRQSLASAVKAKAKEIRLPNAKNSSRVPVAFIREFYALAARHGVKNSVVGVVPGRVSASTVCPNGTKPRRVVIKDEFGNTVIKTICV